MNIEFKISKNPVNYKKALVFLEKRVELVKQGGKELVWLLEHPLTYSAGIRSKKEEILDKSITVLKTESMLSCLHHFLESEKYTKLIWL